MINVEVGKEIVININETISKLMFLIKQSNQIYFLAIYSYILCPYWPWTEARLFIQKDSPFRPTTNSAHGRIFTQVEEEHQQGVK